MNRPDAIFTDLDGTLLGPDKKIGERDAAAIRRLGELGIPVIPCTGRPIQGARPVTEELGLGLAVCSNGGCCHDFAQDKTLHTVGMDHGVAHRLMVWMEGKGIHYLLHAPGRIYGSPGTLPPDHYLFLENEWGGTVTSESPLAGMEILKLLAVQCDEKAVVRAGQAVFAPEELTICSSEATFVDFNPPGVTKGAGVRWLAERMGWDPKKVIAIGDNYNDLSMLELAGMAAVPAGAIPEAKALADFVAAPCGENPLSAVLAHFFPGLV